jgi:hypothetical protein
MRRPIDHLLAVTALLLVGHGSAVAQCCTWLDPYADLAPPDRSAIFWRDANAAGTAVAALEDALAVPADRQDAADSPKLDELARSAFLTWYNVFDGFKRRAPQEFARVGNWDGLLLGATQALSDGGRALVEDRDPAAASVHLLKFRAALAGICGEAGRPSLPAAIARARVAVVLAGADLRRQPPDDPGSGAKLVETAAEGLRDAPEWLPPAGDRLSTEKADSLSAAFPKQREQQVERLRHAAAALGNGDRAAATEDLDRCRRELQAFALSYGRPLF